MKRTLLCNVKAICSVRIVISASEELPKHWVVTAAGKAKLPRTNLWSVTHGFLTPFGLICQPAK
jgi:hypothetical protein